MEAAVSVIDFLLAEIALFAAFGFLILGLSDLAVDLIWLARALVLKLAGRGAAQTLDRLEAPSAPGRIAVFVPAWDETRVIASMLRHALAAFGRGDYRIYVGCYPNDPGTIAAVRSLADPRLRLVLGPAPGPTTKADCLNRLWEAMRADEETGIM